MGRGGGGGELVLGWWVVGIGVLVCFIGRSRAGNQRLRTAGEVGGAGGGGGGGGVRGGGVCVCVCVVCFVLFCLVHVSSPWSSAHSRDAQQRLRLVNGDVGGGGGAVCGGGVCVCGCMCLCVCSS